MVYYRILKIVPCAIYIRTFFNHFKCSSLHLPTLNSLSARLPLSLYFGNHNSVFYVYESISVLEFTFFLYHRLNVGFYVGQVIAETRDTEISQETKEGCSDPVGR